MRRFSWSKFLREPCTTNQTSVPGSPSSVKEGSLASKSRPVEADHKGQYTMDHQCRVLEELDACWQFSCSASVSWASYWEQWDTLRYGSYGDRHYRWWLNHSLLGTFTLSPLIINRLLSPWIHLELITSLQISTRLQRRVSRGMSWFQTENVTYSVWWYAVHWDCFAQVFTMQMTSSDIWFPQMMPQR